MAEGRLSWLVEHFPAALARLGVVDREKGREAFDLAAPVMVTGTFRVVLLMLDFVLVGIALGDVGIASLELGFQYYFIPFGLSLALSSGTISVVSRYTGADRPAMADFTVKQSVWLALLVSVPVAAATWLYAEPMVDVLTDTPETIALGADYLRVVMVGLSFRFVGMIAARALAGTGDTRTPMYVRFVSIPVNLVVSAVLVFGVGPFAPMGVVGAAVGTVLANVTAAVVFLALLLSGRYAVTLRLGGKQWDWGVVRELVRVSLPLAGTRLARSFGRFPFVFVLAAFGPGAIAAYGIGRRVVLLAMMPAWGYSTAASTLVGQSIGRGDADLADDYGWQTTRIALATQLLIAGVLVLAARPIALLFGTDSVALTVDFIRVFGLAVAGYSVSRTMRGGLRGAGDTRWPFYGTLAGTYLLRLPVAFLALPVDFAVRFGPLPALGPLPGVGPLSFTPGLGYGFAAVFAAILVEIYTKALVNAVRFESGVWKDVARRSGVGATSD